jgi:hypothetical protein
MLPIWQENTSLVVKSHFFVNLVCPRAGLRRVIDSRGQKLMLVQTQFFALDPTLQRAVGRTGVSVGMN